MGQSGGWGWEVDTPCSMVKYFSSLGLIPHPTKQMFSRIPTLDIQEIKVGAAAGSP